METTTNGGTVTTYSETAYVAWGVDEETGGGSCYWIAVWDDDGPQSPETFADDKESAQNIASDMATMTGLEFFEVDEFGAVPQA